MKEDWVEVELGEVCEITMGQSPPSSTYSTTKNGLPFYQGKAEFTDLHPVAVKWCTEPKKIANEGDILISVRAPVGSTNIANEKCGIGRGLAAISFKYSNLYLWFYLKNIEMKLDSQGTGTTFKAISGSTLRTQIFPLVPLPIQRAIVTKIENLFTSLDKGIADLKKAQEQLKVYRQAVLKKAFEGKFVKDATKWQLFKINSLCEVVRGGSPRPAGDPKFYDGPIPFLKVADLTRNEGAYLKTHTYSIKEAGLKKTRLVSANTLLLSNSGATLGIPKICAFETTFNDGIAAFLGLKKETLLYHYYFWLSKTKELRNINQGAAQPNLNTIMIGAMEIPVGSVEDQLQTVMEIESRLSVCDIIEQNITETLEKSEALRQSILKRAFEGKLLSEAEITKCKQEVDYEPASILLERIKQKK